MQDIEALVEAGAVVEVVKGPVHQVALPLAAVATNGTVNLQPGSRILGSEDTIVALVRVRRDPSASDHLK
jgi:hypothetical protein